MNDKLRAHLWEGGLLLIILLQYHAAFRWILHTWRENTYESWGFVALLCLLPKLRTIPPLRALPSTAHLLGICLLALVDLLLAPLRLNILSALLGICSLHLGCVAFRAYRGRWYLHAQLWLALLSLPLVFWANAAFGYQLQHLACKVAAQGLSLYGLSVDAQGTLLQLPSVTIAVDTTCSGLKLIYTGVIFGILAAPSAHSKVIQGIFWCGLIGLLFGANVMRIMSLTMAHLQFGHPVNDLTHELLGLLAFAMACGLSLFFLRWLTDRSTSIPCHGPLAAPAVTT